MTKPDRELMRLEALKMAASLNAPNREIAPIFEIADKLWRWIEIGEAPVSKTRANVERSVARLASESNATKTGD